MAIRYFGSVKLVTAEGAVIADRLDDVGRVFIADRDASLAGDLVVGDVVEFSIRPGGIGVDVLLSRRARRLLASEAAA